MHSGLLLMPVVTGNWFPESYLLWQALEEDQKVQQMNCFDYNNNQDKDISLNKSVNDKEKNNKDNR